MWNFEFTQHILPAFGFHIGSSPKPHYHCHQFRSLLDPFVNYTNVAILVQILDINAQAVVLSSPVALTKMKLRCADAAGNYIVACVCCCGVSTRTRQLRAVRLPLIHMFQCQRRCTGQVRRQTRQEAHSAAAHRKQHCVS